MEITLSETELDAILAHPLVRGLLECSSDGAVVIDARTRRVVAMNRKAELLLGRAPGAALGCACHETLRSTACQQACPLTRAAEGLPLPEVVALYYRTEGDEIVHANARMLLVRDPSGQPLAGIELFQDQREVRALERALRTRRSLHGLTGRSERMQALYDRVEEMAPCDTPVLVLGEPGTGKRRVAEALHAASRRNDGPLLAIAADSLPPSRAAAALREGLHHCADGTLLLCRVDRAGQELVQALDDLLRTGAVQLGGEVLALHPARLVLTASDAERLPAGLRARLADVTVPVPPLRDRVEDLPLLVDELLRDLPADEVPAPTAVEPGVLAALARRAWPGNLAELGACLRAASLRAAGRRLEVGDLQLADDAGSETLADLEALAIHRALAATEGNLSAAARLLGIDRSTLWRKLKRAPAVS